MKTFERTVAKRCPTWSCKKRLQEKLREVRAQFTQIDAKLMNREALNDDEQALYELGSGDDLDVDWSKKRRPRRKKKKKTKSAKQIKAMFKKRKARKKALEKQMRRLRALEDDGVFLECFQCFEEATKRKCCGGQLCDFCYDMSGACPACGVAVKDMLGKGFLTRLLEREVEKRVASDA